MKSHSKEPQKSPYIRPKELAIRWQCSRSSVDRYAKNADISKLYLGNGENSIVLYDRKEVEAYEETRRITR